MLKTPPTYSGNGSVSLDARKAPDRSDQSDFLRFLAILTKEVKAGRVRLKYLRWVYESRDDLKPKKRRGAK